MEEKQGPVHEIRLGRIRVTIWGRTTNSESVEYYTKLSRHYKDDEGKWTEAYGYWPEDLPIVLKLARNADDWISKRKAKDNLAKLNF